MFSMRGVEVLSKCGRWIGGALTAAVVLGIGATVRGQVQQQPFTVIALPDTQYYTQTTSRNNTYFKGQMNWIVANRAALNIKMVMGLGDVQNDGNPYYASTTDPYRPDLTRPTGLVADEHEWINADASLDILDKAGIPQSIVPGNHDYLDNTIKKEPIYFLKWFGPQRFAGKSYFGGASPETPTSLAGLNTWYTFEGAGRKFLNIGLQFAPDTHDLAWAQSVINQNPGLPTIVTTHAFLDTNSIQSGRGNIWTNFVKNNPQVIMTMNGHINGAYRQAQTNIAGQAVQEMLVDYQATDYSPYFKGGGYLRLLQFDPAGKSVHVKSYSPVIGNYLTDDGNQFDLPMDLDARFGAVAPWNRVNKSTSFRQGAGGYTGAKDTYVSQASPATASGAATSVLVDGDSDDAAEGTQQNQAMVRFDNLFGTGAGQIPAGARIESATLTVKTATTTNGHSVQPMSAYRMLGTWSESSTWNSLSGGVSTDGVDAILSADGSVTPAAQGETVGFDVTESLATWAMGAPNHGWTILAGGADGWRFYSSDTSVLADRPVLNVTYSLVPEPVGVGVWVMVWIAAGRFGRRRRH